MLHQQDNARKKLELEQEHEKSAKEKEFKGLQD